MKKFSFLAVIPPNKASSLSSIPEKPIYVAVVMFGLGVGVGRNSAGSGSWVTSSKPHMSSRILAEMVSYSWC